jgi:diamine N-acetyltransferase
MIALRKITWENFDDVISLKIAPEQDDFIADNVYSLAQSYVALSNGDTPYPFAAYKGDECIGFVFMAYEETGDVDEDGNVAEETGFHIVRFMIDQKHQGKGYGKELMKVCLDWMKEKTAVRPFAVNLSYNDNNTAARNLYASFGFAETGETNDAGEVEAKLYIY